MTAEGEVTVSAVTLLTVADDGVTVVVTGVGGVGNGITVAGGNIGDTGDRIGEATMGVVAVDDGDGYGITGRWWLPRFANHRS